MEKVLSIFKNKYLKTLLDAIKTGDYEKSLEIVNSEKSDYTYTDENGNTPLILACKYEMQHVAVILIRSGRSNPEHINKIGQTAIKWARYNRMYEVLKLLSI